MWLRWKGTWKRGIYMKRFIFDSEKIYTLLTVKILHLFHPFSDFFTLARVHWGSQNFD